MTQAIDIAPSILAANFLQLGEDVRVAEKAGVRRLHLDVMDGRFVPNISFGTPIVSAIRGATALMLETHLMIVEPDKYLATFADCGADLITVHVEVSPHLYRTLQEIHRLGKKAGVAINPATPWTALEEVLDLADLVLVMTVSPGFGGQEFIEAMVPKIRCVRRAIDERGLPTELEVDGGIEPHTIGTAAEAGARVFVAGTAVYRSSDSVAGAVRDLKETAERAAG